MNLINNLADMKSAIKDLNTLERLAHDTETMGPPDIGGLFPFHGSRSFAHVFASADDEFYFNFNIGGINPKYKADLQELFDKKDRLWFYVNAPFDNTIMHFDGLKNHGRIADLASLARVEFNEHGKDPSAKETFLSLEYLAEYYGSQPKIDAVKKYIEEHNLYSEKVCRLDGSKIPLYNRVPLDIMFPYGCGDGRSTYDTGIKIIKCINHKDELFKDQNPYNKKMIDVAKNEIRLTSVVIDMKITGFQLDQEYIKKAIAHETVVRDTLTSEVNKIAGDINLNSPKQLAEFLTEQGVQLPVKPVTETAYKRAMAWKEKAELALSKGNQKQYEIAKAKADEYIAGNKSTDKKVLEKVLAKYPHLDVVTKIRRAKEADKKIGTYYNNFLKMVDDYGFIHCNFHQDTTKTGRCSVRMPALQTLEKKPEFAEWGVRRAFYCPDEMFDLFFFDYDQQEMIVMLDQAGQLDIIKKLLDGDFEDFYIATAAVLKEQTGKIITRQVAKALALGLAYGQGKDLLAENMGMTVEESLKFKNEFFRALPKIAALADQLQRQAKRYGKIHNPFGRVSYIDKGFEYKALNSFIQGMSADITKTAMVNIYEFLTSLGCLSKLLLSVHDELIFKIHKNERWLVPEIRRIMSEAYPHNHIKLSTGVEYGKTWGEKYEWKLTA